MLERGSFSVAEPSDGGGMESGVKRRARICRLLAGMVGAALCGIVPCSSSRAADLTLTGRIEALLAVRCLECHAGEDPQGGLALHDPIAFARGGASGPALVPGNADASLLIRAVRRQDPAVAPMPPDDTLAADEISLLEEWVGSGADWPTDAAPAEADGSPVGAAWDDPRNPVARRWRGERLDLWSFQPLLRPAVPEGSRDDGETVSHQNPSNVIDALISAGLVSHTLRGAPPADRRTLIRRMAFDVTGLPPSPEAVEAFVADNAPDAVERLVDQLLASPAYGEHLAVMWLDAVRYADTNGFERDELRPQIWRYRDWCIAAFNADLPYDRFLAEQLAGDELAADPPVDQGQADALVATGYLRLGPFDSTAPIFQEAERHRAELLAEIVATTGSAVLGLPMSCCNCHDHKSDPLLQADFFRMQACFQGTEARDAAIDTQPVVAQIAAHNQPLEEEIARITQSRDSVVMRRDQLPPAAEPTAEGVVDQSAAEPSAAHSALVRGELDAEIAAFDTALSSLKEKLGQPTMAQIVSEPAGALPPTHILAQGSHREPREEVQPGVFSAFDPGPLAIETPSHGTTSGRRLALARWLTSEGNPLTSRVMVNRIWQRLFGRGIVATPNDFGFRGAPPTHPALLDALAVEFRDRGWSLKDLHRWILLSETYQRASVADADPEALRVDPENRLLGKQNPRRLEAEAIRDALLAVSGLLRDEHGGPPRWPPVADDILHANPAIIEFIKEGADGRPQGWYTQPVEETFVRSIYLVKKRSLPIPFLQPFDLPDGVSSCGRRDVTTVAPQSLNLLNDDLVIRAAAALADRVRAVAGNDPSAWPVAVVRLALQRDPTAEEVAASADLLHRHTHLHMLWPSDCGESLTAGAESSIPPEQRALADLCRAILNVNEFVFID